MANTYLVIFRDGEIAFVAENEVSDYFDDLKSCNCRIVNTNFETELYLSAQSNRLREVPLYEKRIFDKSNKNGCKSE